MATENRLKKHMEIILPVIVLILIDQAVKIYISANFMNSRFYFIDGIIGFKPQLNTEYSWINDISNLGITLIPHLIITALILMAAILIYGYMRDNCTMGRMEKGLFTFLFAGAFCSFLDKAFWGGSLDYILLEGFFIFDLKDLYITVFEVITILCVLFNYKGLRKFDEKKFLLDFKNYMKLRYFKK